MRAAPLQREIRTLRTDLFDDAEAVINRTLYFQRGYPMPHSFSFATVLNATLAIVLCGGAVTNAQEGNRAQQGKVEPSEPAPVVPAQLGEIYNLHRCGDLLIAGQPTPADLALLKQQGIQSVVTFRTEGEIDWDEQAAVEAAGMDFQAIRYGSLDSLTDEVFAASRKLLRENRGKPILLHCGAAVRVAAVWLTYRVLDEGVDLERALDEAQKMGLRSKALRQRAVAYIENQQQQQQQR